MIKKILKDIRLYFVAVYVVLAVAFLLQLFISNFLPSKYFLAITIVLLLFGFLLWWIQYSKKTNKGVKVLGKILLVVLSIFLIVGNIYFHVATSSVDKVTNDDMTKQISVVVMKDSPVKKIADLENKKLGVLSIGETSDNEKAITDISKDATGVTTQAYESIKEYKDALYNGDIDGVILDEGMRGSLVEETETFSKDTRVVKTYDYEGKIEDIAKRVNVKDTPFIVYISGIDTYGGITTAGRSDVNKIMVVNPNTHKILLIDIPRDYYIPQVCQGMQNDKLTHTGIFGVDCSVNSVAGYFGIDINYYIRVNFSSLEDIVNALGNIHVNSAYSFSAQGYTFSVGDNVLDGAEALAFSRERHSFAGGDHVRVQNQSLVLSGIIDKATSPAIITNYMGVMNAVGDSIQTNMNSDEITSLINMQLDSMQGWDIQSYAVSGSGGSDWTPANGFNAYVMYPDTTTVEQAKQYIQAVYDGNAVTIE